MRCYPAYMFTRPELNSTSAMISTNAMAAIMIKSVVSNLRFSACFWVLHDTRNATVAPFLHPWLGSVLGLGLAGLYLL